MINIDLIYPDIVDDYVVLEMQGQLENNTESQRFDALPLGSLIKLEGGKYKFMIGIHDLIGSIYVLLEGTLVSLKEPLLNPKTLLFEKQIIVQGVCKHKILFSVRPTPILDRLAKKEKSANKEFPAKKFKTK